MVSCMMRTCSAVRASQRRVYRESQLDECSLSSSLRTEKRETRDRGKKESDEGKEVPASLLFKHARCVLCFPLLVPLSMEPCRFNMACWHPLCPFRHSGPGRAARLAAVRSSPADDLPVPQVVKENLEEDRVIELAESPGEAGLLDSRHSSRIVSW